MATFASILSVAKRRTFLATLEPAGFEKGKHAYIRLMDIQVHGIQVQNARGEPKYFVNVMFHYSFIPPLFLARDAKEQSPLDFDVLDFMFYDRLELFMETGYPREWSFDGDPGKVEETFATNMRNALIAFQQLSNRWKDPASLMHALPPDLLIRNHLYRLDNTNEPAKEWPWLSGPLENAIGIPWIQKSYYVAYCLAHIAVHLKDGPRANEYLALAEGWSRGTCDYEPLNELRLAVQGVQMSK